MLPLIVSRLVCVDGLVSCLREGSAHLFPFPSSNGCSQSGLGIPSQYIPFDSLSPWACWRSSILFTGGVTLEFCLSTRFFAGWVFGTEYGIMTCTFVFSWRWVMVSWSGHGRLEGRNMGFRWTLAHIIEEEWLPKGTNNMKTVLTLLLWFNILEPNNWYPLPAHSECFRGYKLLPTPSKSLPNMSTANECSGRTTAMHW